jgi:hypothetical protein
MKHISTSIAILALTAISTVAAPPDPSKLPPASAKTGLTFDKDIHPIFDTACVRCHGEVKHSGNLRLDTLDGVMKGTKDGKIVTVGHGEQSKLVFAVASIDGKVAMPPKPKPRKGLQAGGTNAPAPAAQEMAAPAKPMPPWKPLTPEQVGLIRAWIDQGAK